MEINKKMWLKMPIEKIIFWAIGFALILPILVLPPYFQPSDWTRTILFKITLTLLAAFLLFRFFYAKDISFSVPKPSIFSMPLFLMTAYFITLAIATAFSQDPYFSVFGSPSRAGGFLNLAFFFLFTCLLAFLVKGDAWQKLLKVNFVAGALASLLAIVQYFGLFNDIFLDFETGSTPSFLGNSTFLAMYMLFLVFAAFDFFVNTQEKKKRLAYAGLCLLFLFTIFISGSRATYLGIVIGFVFYFLLYPVRLVKAENEFFPWLTPRRFKIFKIAFTAFVALILLGLLYVNLAPNLPSFIEHNTQLSYFFHNRLSVKLAFEDLTGARLPAWQITWESIKERPWFGWGPENSYIGFEKHFDPKSSQALQRLWWDRPHNIFLEVWADAGIFALIAYLAFWSILFACMQIAKKRQGSAKAFNTIHAIQAMVIGYLFVLFFNFNSFATYLISFFFIGYAFYLLNIGNEHKEILPPAAQIPLKKPLAITLLAIVGLFFWFWNLKPLYLNEKIVLAHNQAKSKQCKKAIKTAESTDWANAGIITPYAASRYADVMKRCTYIAPEKEAEYAKKTLALLASARDIQPYYSRTWVYMGAFANVLAAREQEAGEKSNILAEGRAYLKKALELSPARQEIFIEVEKNYMLAKGYQAMKDLAYECIRIDQSQGYCYWYLGIAEIFMGDQEQGKKHIQESQDKHYNDPPYIQLAVAYVSQKSYKDAVNIYEKLIAIYPDSVSYHATLALLYKEIGEFDKASEQAKIVFKIQPDNPETIEFIKLLIGANPTNLDLLYALVDIHKTLGDTEKYRQDLREIASIYASLIARNPNNPYNHFNLAYTYEELGDHEKAVQEAIEAYTLDIKLSNQVENFLRTISADSAFQAIEYISRQEILRRISRYQSLIKRSPNNSEYHFQLAIAYRDFRDNETAVTLAVKAFRLGPQLAEEIKNFLQTIPTKTAEIALKEIGQ